MTNHSHSDHPPQTSGPDLVRIASPGRINLIGEHTDYNNGYVLPTAIDRKIYFELSGNNRQSLCRVYSSTFDSRFEFDLNSIEKSDSGWQNYILGVVDELQKAGKKLKGFDCSLRSELPIGAGISSSAALECGLAFGLNELFKLGLSRPEIAAICQAAENNFVGSNCGIMDQYASVMSRENKIILLDCLTLKAEFIPANFQNCKLLLVNTKVSHNLAEGEYNTRRRECESALLKIRENHSGISTLRDVDEALLEEIRQELTNKQYERVKFVLEENQRVLQATELIKNGKLMDFGKLMYHSHYGLRDLYEVSCKELDFLVAFTEDKEYIYGSRMMGGGFGGCTINLIEEDRIAGFRKLVSEAYNKEFGFYPDIITVTTGEGTKLIPSEK